MLENFINYIPDTWILLTVSAVILFFSFTRKNNNFFDIRKVFSQHFAIFNGNMIQVFIFFVIPFLMSIGIAKIKLIDKDIINNINIVLSIFISMFFAMLSILCSLPKQDEKSGKHYNDLLIETFNTIIFECVICVVLLVLSFIELFVDSFQSSWQLFLSSLIIYYLILVVVFNIFILIKRIKTLFDGR